MKRMCENCDRACSGDYGEQSACIEQGMILMKDDKNEVAYRIMRKVLIRVFGGTVKYFLFPLVCWMTETELRWQAEMDDIPFTGMRETVIGLMNNKRS